MAQNTKHDSKISWEINRGEIKVKINRPDKNKNKNVNRAKTKTRTKQIRETRHAHRKTRENKE